MPDEIDRARDALNSIPADLPRDDWVKAGMAAHAAGLAFSDFDTWSATADSYDAKACIATWRSFKSTPGGVGAGTLFSMARNHGWTEGNARAAPAQPKRPTEPSHKPAPGMSAAEVWGRCLPVKSHPYAIRKQLADVVLPLLRVVSDADPLTYLRGWLAVPGYGPDGALQTIEFIPPGDGKKMTLKDSHKSGASLTVGPNDGPVVVVEGLADASAVFSATGGRAVSCFGSGNIRRVVETLRQNEPETKIVIAPDRGKETDAKEIAAEFNCAVACLPECEPNNFDVNDLFQRDGFDVVQAMLESATMPPKPEPKVHPLARYVGIGGAAKPPRWVIPGFIGHGVTVIAGAHGVGKTTALLPLAMNAAGLHGDDLMPRQWRHVVYVTEDVEQALRILAGIVGHSSLNINLDLVRERIHIVEAVRLDPAFVAAVGSTYREQFTRTVEGVEVLPLVVLDTKSAVMAIANENDNSEVSSMMAALKQGFEGLPVWLIGHVAKVNLNRNDALTSRGASAIEGDANQTLFLIREGEKRYLVQGKTRFEAKWRELEITSYTAQTSAVDEFGDAETVLLRWGVATPARQSHKEAAEQASEQQYKADEAILRQDIRDAVQVAWLAGNPLNREGIKAKCKRKHSEAIACLEGLLSEQWLYEVFVPAKERLHPRKSSFFINLTTEEHEAVLSGAGLPAAKLVIPTSWKKALVSIMPDAGHGCTTNEVTDHE